MTKLTMRTLIVAAMLAIPACAADVDTPADSPQHPAPATETHAPATAPHELTSLEVLDRVEGFYNRAYGMLLGAIGILLAIAGVIQLGQYLSFKRAEARASRALDEMADSLRAEMLEQHSGTLAIQAMMVMDSPLQNVGFVLLTVNAALESRSEAHAPLHPFRSLLAKALRYLRHWDKNGLPVRDAPEAAADLIGTLGAALSEAETADIRKEITGLKAFLEGALAADTPQPEEPES